MKSKLLFAALFFAAASHCFAQVPENAPGTVDERSAQTATDEPVKKASGLKAEDEGSIEPASPVPVVDKKVDPPIEYRRPDRTQRFKNYLDNIAGPAALTYYAVGAGLLTLRNSPKEWGAKSDGFGRRLANVTGKNLIRGTTMYALDEALKVDSKFYPSRERTLTGRLRNSVFSAVTARDRKGKRVIGLPAIAGGLLSEVVSSSGWYPQRYDYVHGLKGGAISLGITAGMNLLKEFVWKPK